MSDEKTSVKEVMTAFEAFKETNDARLTEIEKRGAADTVTETKLAKIETTLAAHEDANQKLTLAAAQTKKVEDELKAFKDIVAKLEAKIGRPGAGADIESKAKATAEYKDAFDSYLRNTDNGLTADERKTLTEYKVLLAGTDTLGGYYLTPAEMQAEIIKAVILQSPFRSLAKVVSIGGQSLKQPKRTGTFAATRVGETQARTETTGYTTGMTEIFAPEMYAEVRISEQMIEDSMFDIEAEMMSEFAEQFAVKEGAEFINGTGTANSAYGIFASSDVRETVTGSAAALTADGLVNAFYGTSSTTGLKTAYARNANWIFNRATLGAIRKLKDGNGAYIWLPGVANAAPNTIIGATYVEMPDMPDVGAGLYPVAVGDFNRAYRIVDRVLISVLRDPFTVSGSGQILFRARKRVGGAVILGEAIVKVKCST